MTVLTQPHLQDPKMQMPVHYVGIHPTRYQEQPQGMEMGKIINYFKRKGIASKVNLLDIFTAASQGQSIIPANFEVEGNHDKGQLGSIRFVSSSLILIDIDDDACITNPSFILAQLQGKCAGYFYTFSHGIKGNRYRLVFALSRAITNEQIYKNVVQQLAAEIRNLIDIPTGSNIQNPIDTQAKVPTTPVRTGRLQPVISDLQAQLDPTEYIQKAHREELRRAEAAKAAFEDGMKYKTPFSELKRMAEKIGYLATGSGEGELWRTLAMGIKYHVLSGAIDENEGYELFSIISGPETSDKAWNNFKPNGQATIASLVKAAQKRGFKRKPYSYALATSSENYEKEYHKVKDYIPTDLAKEFIERREKLLIESPTGSGKSTSFINASKQLSKENPTSSRIFIFAVPTITLAKQLAKKHNVMCVVGSTGKGLWSDVYGEVKLGNRVFIATYDMTQLLMNWISEFNCIINPSFALMVDEYHKTVTDYSSNYRRDALVALHQAVELASSFIALSGTPDDILKTDFDKIIEIDNGKLGSPCQEFAVYTYEKQKDALPTLVKLVETWTKQRRLLIYVQSKEMIAKLYDLLRKRGIKTRTVTANEKRNNTYKTLVEEEAIPNDVQVVLATSVIADGINILNLKRDENGQILRDENGHPLKDIEWECIVVANHFSDLFNAATVKQISNRFRNEYRRFSIFMQQAINKETDLYQIDTAYKFVYGLANKFAARLNEEFSAQNLSLFRASIIEKHYGITTDATKVFADKYYIRYDVSKAQEKYYGTRRNAFIKAVEKALRIKSKGTLNITEQIRKNELDLAPIDEAIAELVQQTKLDREARKAGIVEMFTPEIYQAFHNEDEAVLNEFKQFVLPEHFACIKGIYKYTTYTICKKIVTSVKRRCDIHAFNNRIQRLVDIWHFEAVNRRTETKRLYQAILEHVEQPFVTDELDFLVKQIAQREKVSLEATKKVVNGFFLHESSRMSKARLTKLKALTVDLVANEFGLEANEIISSLVGYGNNQSRIVATVIQNRVAIYQAAQLEMKLG